MNECMVDLETMSSESNAPIIAIGATVFDVDKPFDPATAQKFYVNVDLKDVMRYGLLPRGETIMWWMNQSEAARTALLIDPQPLNWALGGFSTFYNATDCRALWSHATFDAVVLRSAYAAVYGILGDSKSPPTPWNYRDTRDIRTLKSLFSLAGVHGVPGGDYPGKTVEHNALDDALEQAYYTHQMLQKIKGLQNETLST